MKSIILTLAITALTWHYAAPVFVQQMHDYKASDACIKGFTDVGYERSAIEVNGPDCSLKVGEL